MIFGTLKDNSSSNIRKYRTHFYVTEMFSKIASTVSQKCLIICCPKAQLFLIFRTIPFCSNLTSIWSKYLSNNVLGDLRIPMSASVIVTLNDRSENQFLQ